MNCHQECKLPAVISMRRLVACCLFHCMFFEIFGRKQRTQNVSPPLGGGDEKCSWHFSLSEAGVRIAVSYISHWSTQIPAIWQLKVVKVEQTRLKTARATNCREATWCGKPRSGGRRWSWFPVRWRTFRWGIPPMQVMLSADKLL